MFPALLHKSLFAQFQDHIYLQLVLLFLSHYIPSQPSFGITCMMIENWVVGHKA